MDCTVSCVGEFVLFGVLTRLGGGSAPHNDSASTSSRCFGPAPAWTPLTRRGTPRGFVDFLLLFLLGLVALSFFLLGWWGPLPCFPLPPGPRLGGWVPLAAFSPVVSLCFSGGGGGGSFFLCYLLLLASLSLSCS